MQDKLKTAAKPTEAFADCSKPPQTFEVIRGDGARRLLECAKTPPAPSQRLIDSAKKS